MAIRTLQEADNLNRQVAPHENLANITTEKVDDYKFSFCRMLDNIFTSQSSLLGVKQIDQALAIADVESLGITKEILSLKSNKNIAASLNTPNVLARVANASLQNDGDEFVIEYPKFDIRLTFTHKVKIVLDSKAIVQLAGATTVTTVSNAALADCIKDIQDSAVNNPGCLKAINEGRLNSNVKKEVYVPDVAVYVDFKDYEKEEK